MPYRTTVNYPFVLFLLLLLSLSAKAAPEAEYWPFWDHATNSQQTIDHSLWDDFLKTYVKDPPSNSMYVVDYRNVSPESQKNLKSYLQKLQSTDPRQYNSDEQFAYWVNLYNALTVQLILDDYPVDSIRSIGSWLKLGPWNNTVAEVASQKLTLNDIEHRILRPIWQDARIHYAVNCASIGCPDLLPQAWTGQHREQLLEQAAHRYISQNKGVEREDTTLYLSSIYKWYRTDFGTQEQLMQHLAHYAPPAKAEQIKNHTGEINYRYNWDLNSLPKP